MQNSVASRCIVCEQARRKICDDGREKEKNRERTLAKKNPVKEKKPVTEKKKCLGDIPEEQRDL